ncbi:MAG: Secreted protease metal-dependent protease [Candidatus Ozemobacter sibiricus]|uniref:Secreted protease metal-dependent protease n=1 Tax=Candidatus Ozemobacter sibiricus TaxID=2268124 RepID=A0A367ZRL4_9BACT|nr:MAG: Secreted protease metal-dependent protease [Candidatus Ozemobacter sibiricus]
MKRCCWSLLFVLLACTAFASDLPAPDWQQLRLDEATPLDPDRPTWVDATPLFDDMARAAATRFRRITRRTPREGVPIGGEETFWAMNIATKQFERVTAVLERIGKHCYLYVEKGQKVDGPTLDSIVAQFDTNIYPTDTRCFGSEPKPGIDGDNRITLLMLDIKDGWEPGKGYVGGYFFPLNEYSVKDFPQSNEREMIYLDLYPSDPKDKFYMGVVAHEFQHLIHFNQDPRETKWINEGQSQYAFKVCGFGHPNQIMAFTRAPDHTIADWKNSITDYGAVYLFFYYLYQKYPGTTTPMSLLVSSNPKQGIESIDEALAKGGYQTTFEKVWSDWSVANYLNDPYNGGGKWHYDETLPVKVMHRTVDPRSGPQAFKDTVQPWATDYYRVESYPFWSPPFPTVADIICVNLPGPGFVLWNVNDGVLPPKELWPPDTRELEPGKTLLTRCGGNYPVFKFGPVLDKGITKVNFSLFNPEYVSTDHGQITITPKDPNLMPLEGKVQIDVAAKKGVIFGPKEAPVVRLVVESCQTKVYDLPLDKDWKATKTIAGLGAELNAVSLLVGNTTKKPLEYDVKFTLNPQPTMRGYLAGLERGQQLLATLEPLMKDGQPGLDELYQGTTRQIEEITRAAADLLDPARTPEAVANARILAAAGAKPGYEPLLRLLAERRTFAAGHGEATDPAVEEALAPLLNGLSADRQTADDQTAAAPPATRGDETDTSHTNILYLCNKKQELINALTHLKIDPQFLEGQILQMYKILQLSLNLPNIPFPEGLGIVDYDETAAQSWIDTLRAGGEPASPVKEALKRLTIFEDLVERLYNNNLLMAEDFGYTLHEAVKLVLTGRSTLLQISNGLANVPIVGTLTQKVVKLIIGKSIGIITRVTNLIAVKLKPPYSTIVPIVVQLGGSVAARLLQAPVTEETSWMKPWAAKTVAKYAFVSLPKVGYVAKTQSFLDTAVTTAVKGDFTGTTEAARRAVLDDEDPQTATSLFEEWAADLAKKHAFTLKEVEAAKIAKAVAQIAGYASLIDPTNISKVVGIISATFSGGALVHGMTSSLIEFCRTRGQLEKGLHLAFHPDQPLPQTKASDLPRLPVKAAQFGATLRTLGTLKADYHTLANRARQAFAAHDTAALAAVAEELVAFEEAYEPTDRLWTLTCEAALAGTSREGDLAGMTDQAIAADLARADVLAALLPAAAGTLPAADLPARLDRAVATLDARLAQCAQVLAKTEDDALAPRVGLTQVKAEPRAGGWTISAVATLIAPQATEVSFTLYGAPDTTIAKAPRPQILQPWDSVAVEWFLDGTTQSGYPVTVAVDGEALLPGSEMILLP